MKKIILLFTLLSYICIMTSCARVEAATLQQYSDTIQIETTMAETNIEQAETLILEEQYNISEENGRLVSVQYGSDDYVLKIDATVFTPEVDVVKGTLREKSIDMEIIEKHLCNGESLHELTGQQNTKYVSENNTVDNDLNYDIGYTLTGNGKAHFDNFQLDAVFGSDDVQMVEVSMQTDEQKMYVSDMENDASMLFESLELEGNVSHSWLYSGSQNKYCTVFINSQVGELPLYFKTCGNFLQSNINISENGVNNVVFTGLYEFGSTENVDVMPLDEALSIIEDGIESKYINNISETISSITMAYMLDNEDDLTFYPVWCFCSSYFEESGEIPFLCINAVTGEIEFMAG